MDKKQKTIATGIISAIVILAGIGIYAASGSSAPDPEKLSDTDAIKYAASKDFASLPQKEKMEYARRMHEKMKASGGNPWRMMRDKSLSDADRKQLRANMRALMPAMMRERAKKFMAMSKEERDKEYDRIANEIKKRIAANGGRRRPQGNNGSNNTNNNNNRKRDGSRFQEFMKRRLEGTDSDTRAMMAEMRKEIRKRMQKKK